MIGACVYGLGSSRASTDVPTSEGHVVIGLESEHLGAFWERRVRADWAGFISNDTCRPGLEVEVETRADRKRGPSTLEDYSI